MYKTKEYKAWEHAKGRCYCPTDSQFKHYGGRGITMCEEWRNSFQAFFDALGPAPHPKAMLERPDNDRGYESGNCVWADAITQHNNTRANPRVNGLTLAQIARQHGLNYISFHAMVRRRMKKGLSLDQAVTKALDRYHL